MNPLLDRLAALDAARVVIISAMLFILLIDAAWAVSAFTAPFVPGQLVAALAAGVIGLTALLYKG